jgi:hypothetical protein
VEVWVEGEGIFATIGEMKKIIVLSMEEEVNYVRIVSKMEEKWSILLRGYNS